MSIYLESNKHITIISVLYYFWKLLYEIGSILRAYEITSNHYVYSREFCTGFQKKLMELIDDPEYVYMLGIVTLFDRTHKSIEFMEAMWSADLQHVWKWVTM